MNPDPMDIRAKKLKEMILSNTLQFNYYADIFENYLMPAGYRFVFTIPRKTSEQLLNEINLPLWKIAFEAYRWSTVLSEGSEIPKEKYDIIYKYCEYLNFISAERTASDWKC
jgi:hypothetical protein